MVFSDSAAGTHFDLGGDDEIVNEDEGTSPASGTPLADDVVDEDADLDPADRLPKGAVRNADGSVTLELRFPRTIKSKKGGKISETVHDRLVFHRLTGADQRAIASASEEMMSVVAFSRSTRINQAVMNALWDKMDGADLTAGGQVINNFFASGRTTGRRS